MLESAQADIKEMKTQGWPGSPIKNETNNPTRRKVDVAELKANERIYAISYENL